MPFSYQLSRNAQSYLRRLSPTLRDRIIAKIRLLCVDPFDRAQSKPLKGTLAGQRSARAGDYRIVFEVINDELVILVIDIGPRGDVYKE